VEYRIAALLNLVLPLHHVAEDVSNSNMFNAACVFGATFFTCKAVNLAREH
jgi:hypothetical protein